MPSPPAAYREGWQALFAFNNIHEVALFFSRCSELMALPQPIAISAEPRPVAALTAQHRTTQLSFRYSAEHPWVRKMFRSPSRRAAA